MASVLKWSNSRLTDVQVCGWKYHLKHEERVRVPTNPPRVRGTVVHEVVRRMMKRRTRLEVVDRYGIELTAEARAEAQGVLPSLDEVGDTASAAFKRIWEAEDVDPEGESLGAAREFTRDRAVSLSLLHRKQVAPHIEPRGVELRVTVAPKDVAVEIEGTLDLVQDELGGYVVPDVKTTEKSPSKSQADDSQQLTMYAMLGLALFKELPRELRLDYLVKTPARGDEKYVDLHTVRDAADITALVHRINAATEAVRKGIYVPADPSTWQCQTCEYRQARNGFPGCIFVRRGDSPRPTN